MNPVGSRGWLELVFLMIDTGERLEVWFQAFEGVSPNEVNGDYLGI